MDSVASAPSGPEAWPHAGIGQHIAAPVKTDHGEFAKSVRSPMPAAARTALRLDGRSPRARRPASLSGSPSQSRRHDNSGGCRRGRFTRW